MIRSLRIKFIVLLLAVSAIALSAAFLLRGLMLRDFRDYLEGEREDRVYWVTADLERSYELHGKWDHPSLVDESVRALLLGFKVRVLDPQGALLMDTDRALDSLTPLMRRRVDALAEQHGSDAADRTYLPYPLFLGGREIGVMEVSFLEPGRNALFVRQSRHFLLWSLVALGGIAVALSVVASGVLTRSLKRLANATAAVGKGDLSARVPARGGDEIAALAADFNRMAEALETQEALRKKLITNLAHELRTPLGAMRGELEAMMDGVLPMDSTQLESLHEEAGRLRRMLEGIEDLAQAQASGLSLRKEQITVKPFLENILGRMALRAGEKGVLLRLDCARDLRAYADPERLSQVVLNILTNALKATDRGGTIDIRAFSRDGGTALQVADTGAGIDQKDLPFIFERFFRSSAEGLGLGLAIVRELVETHGGTIEVDSAPGKGSVFTVILPGQDIHNPS
jgi:two-component system sensor histidine kinase BaeS